VLSSRTIKGCRQRNVYVAVHVLLVVVDVGYVSDVVVVVGMVRVGAGCTLRIIPFHFTYHLHGSCCNVQVATFDNNSLVQAVWCDRVLVEVVK
jgi:hypothetical protein